MELIDEPFLADQIRVELAHQQAMCKALWSMRQDGTLCDITMHVEGCALRVHKAVLSASSPYLKQLCVSEDPEEDSEEKDLQIQNCSLAVCYKMLEYLYTGSYTQFLDSEVHDFYELCKAWRVPDPAKRRQSKAIQKRVNVKVPQRTQSIQCNMKEAGDTKEQIVMDDMGNCVTRPVYALSARPVTIEPKLEESGPPLPDNDLDFSDNEDSMGASNEDNIMQLVEAALSDETSMTTKGRKNKRPAQTAGSSQAAAENELKCMECNIVLETRNLLLAHNVESHFEPGMEHPTQYVCQTAGCIYKTYYDKAMKMHEAYHSEVKTPEVDADTVCDICGRVYPSNERMKVHRHRMHKPKHQMIPCEFCGRLFRLKHEVKDHIMRIHSHRQKLVCSLCGYSCITPEAMDNHKYREHGSETATQ